MTMPINLRHEGSSVAGNHFAPARFAVPAGIADPVERMHAVGALVRAWRREPALALTDTLAGVLNRLPPPPRPRCLVACSSASTS